MYQKTWELPIENHQYLHLGERVLKDHHFQRFSVSQNKHRALLILFACEPDRVKLQFGIEYLKELLKIDILGTTVLVEDAQIKIGQPQFRATLLITKQSEMTPFIYDGQQSEAKSGQDFVSRFGQSPDLKGVMLFVGDSNYDLPAFYHQVEQGCPNVPIFGILSGSYDLQRQRKFLIYHDQVIERGVIGVAFTGEIKIATTQTFDWQPLGPIMRVTKMKRRRTIAENNHQPAAKIYEKYLGIQPDRHFILNVCEFPLLVKRHDLIMARSPMHIEPDGTLEFIADFYEGEQIRLAIGQPRVILEHDRQNAQIMAKLNPEALLMFPCANRSALLGSYNVAQGFSYFKAVCPELAIGFGEGELLRQNRRGGLMNSSMIGIGFTEANDDVTVSIDAFEQQKLTTPATARGKVPLIERVLSFLNVVTQELEKSNAHLAYEARTDELTEVTNRRGIIEKVMILKQQNETFGIIMFDVDKFKQFNDNYGHDFGDFVLRGVAKVAQQVVDEHGIIGRWGGEEFMIILPSFDFEQTNQLATQLRQKIAKNNLFGQGWVTISVCVTQAKSAETMDQLFKRVDQLLYQAKAAGRNKLVSSYDYENE